MLPKSLYQKMGWGNTVILLNGIIWENDLNHYKITLFYEKCSKWMPQALII